MDEQGAQVRDAGLVGVVSQPVVGQRQRLGAEGAQQVAVAWLAQPDQAPGRSGCRAGGQRGGERGQGRVDVSGAVVQQRGDPVGDGAADAELVVVEPSFALAATAAERAVDDPCAGRTDRAPVRAAAGQDPLVAAARADAMDVKGGQDAGPAEVPLGPAPVSGVVASAAGAGPPVRPRRPPDRTLSVAAVSVPSSRRCRALSSSHGSGRSRARVGRNSAGPATGAGPLAAAVLRVVAFSA